jgi:hypothetical protein
VGLADEGEGKGEIVREMLGVVVVCSGGCGRQKNQKLGIGLETQKKRREKRRVGEKGMGRGRGSGQEREKGARYERDVVQEQHRFSPRPCARPC